jgi:hypothetical protein
MGPAPVATSSKTINFDIAAINKARTAVERLLEVQRPNRDTTVASARYYEGAFECLKQRYLMGVFLFLGECVSSFKNKKRSPFRNQMLNRFITAVGPSA